MKVQRWQLVSFGVALACLVATPARADCGGDCNDNGTVSWDELAIGISAALGDSASIECSAMDTDSRDGVTIEELVAATHHAFVGCPAVGTATPTRTPRPTPTIPAGCGDGRVDFANGETCDDDNTLEGDTCPANCRIAPCTADGGMLAIDVSFSAPSGIDLAGATIFLRYPDGVVRIPGMANDTQVKRSVTDTPDGAFVTRNDLDYALRVVLVSTDEVPFPAGRLFSVRFDTCSGSALPNSGDFTCIVENAADLTQSSVEDVTCEVSFP